MPAGREPPRHILDHSGTQHPSRQVLLFFGSLFAIFLLLVLPWPRFRPAWEAFFLAVIRPPLSLLLPGLELTSFPSGDPQGDPVCARIQIADLSLLKPDGSGPVRNLDFDAGDFWRCTALLVALVLSTPFPWKRRILSLAGALIIYYLIVLAGLWFIVWRESCTLLPGFESKWMDRPLETAELGLFAQFTIAIPVLVWALAVLPGTKWVKQLKG